MKTANGYEFKGMVIPEYMAEGVDLYVADHIPPGGFLTAVICNDLSKAVGAADGENIHIIPAYIAYFYNEAPSDCWGSVEKYTKWVKD